MNETKDLHPLLLAKVSEQRKNSVTEYCLRQRINKKVTGAKNSMQSGNREREEEMEEERKHCHCHSQITAFLLL